jgi:transposase
VRREQEDCHEIRVEYRASSHECPCYGGRTNKIHSVREQPKRDIGLRNKPVWLVLRKRRFRCVPCGKVFTEPDQVFGARRRSSRRYRISLARQVARQGQVSEGLVRRSFAEEIGGKLGVGERLSYTPAYQGVDEFAVRKGRLFHTAVSDSQDKKVIGIEPGHTSHSLVDFVNRLSCPEAVQAVAMDMHEPYRQAVQLCCPEAVVVADKFHIIRRVNQALDQKRVKVQNELRQGRRGGLYRSRYLLLRAREHLKETERADWQRLVSDYPGLRQVWEFKERFRAIYSAKTKTEGARCLKEWAKLVRGSELDEFKSVLPMLLGRWKDEILNYFDHRVTNGYVEGKNNRIKVIKRIAYGYRNVAAFAQHILLTNETSSRPKALRFTLHTY